jgi:hypothetical protein
MPSGLVITLYVPPPNPTATNCVPDHVTDLQTIGGSVDVRPVHVMPSGLVIALYVPLPNPTATNGIEGGTYVLENTATPVPDNAATPVPDNAATPLVMKLITPWYLQDTIIP